jgi:beta-galactosidase
MSTFHFFSKSKSGIISCTGLIICLLFFGFTKQTSYKPQLIFIGDSTVKNGSGDGRNGQWGWGDQIACYFDTTKITVVNHARGGRSSRTYISEGLWDKVSETLRPGDYVLIQFGHNDTSPVNDTLRARGTINGIGEETEEIDNLLTHKHEIVHSFGWYLRKYVRDAKAKGATPVLVSPIPRNNFKDGKIVRNANTYGGWAKQIAEVEDIPFIDLNNRSANELDKIAITQGETVIDSIYFYGDHTHTSLAGAQLNARCVVEDVRENSHRGLSRFLRPERKPERFFNENDLITTGVYYYPEHWDESQWDRDLKKIKELGFEFVHYAEFAWTRIEPSEGRYDFAWLDRAVDLAARYDLKVIMCTSTATPPVWLTRNYPEVLIEHENGTKTDHGARQHPSVSNNYYRNYALKMIEKLAQHYGSDTRIMGWQLDNEPRPNRDYGSDAQQRFREWLSNKYRNIDALNKAWGTAFWSQTYSRFDEINIPRFAQMFINSHQILDYNRFSTEEMTSFLDEQAKTIRKYVGENQWITTNYIPEYYDGHLRQSHELDFHSYTRYMVFGENYGTGRKGYRLGPVERIAKANDFFRTIDGVYGVMELQPGQVNWGQINPQPLPGAVRLWLWHVFAGGSRFICTYRYRQPVYGTELYHYGVVGPDGVTPTPGGLEYAQFIEDINNLRNKQIKATKNPEAYEKSRTAILYNHENAWEIERNKQTSEWNTERHIDKYYNALKNFGAPVDFVDEQQDFSKYPVVIAPAYEMIDEMLVKRWKNYVEAGGNLILTCRTGHKNRNGQLFETPFGAPIYPLIGAKIDFYDLLLPQTPDTILFDKQKYTWTSWGEILIPEKNTETWATYSGDFYEGSAAITHHRLGKGTATYIGVDSQDGRLEKAVLKKLYSLLNIPVLDLPPGLHIEYRNGWGIAVNYADKMYDLPVQGNPEYLIGGKEIPGAGVSVWVNRQ